MSGAPTGPCDTCGHPHEWTDKRGYRAEDGHAYKPLAEHTRTPNDEGCTPTYLGLAVTCPRCHSLVDNRKTTINDHLAWHEWLDDELDQLRELAI